MTNVTNLVHSKQALFFVQSKINVLASAYASSKIIGMFHVYPPPYQDIIDICFYTCQIMKMFIYPFLERFLLSL